MKTRQKILLVFLTVALVAIPLFASFAKAAPIVLRAVTFLPMNHPNVDPWVKMMMDRVHKEAKGELTIKWLGGPEVIKAFDQTDALRSGVVEMLPYHPFGYMATLLKEGHCGGLTELTGWEERKSGAFELWDEIIQKKVNAKYLGRVHTGPGIPFWAYTNFKVEKIEDFKGKILRVMPLYIPWLKAMGATTATMPPGDMYTAMERKTIDGFVYPYGMAHWGMHEITKYRIEPGVFTMEAATMINLDAWKKIPKRLQDILMDAITDFEYIAYAQQVVRVDLEREQMMNAGVTVVTLSTKEAKRYRDLAYNTTWEEVTKESPEFAPKMKSVTRRKGHDLIK